MPFVPVSDLYVNNQKGKHKGQVTPDLPSILKVEPKRKTVMDSKKQAILHATTAEPTLTCPLASGMDKSVSMPFDLENDLYAKSPQTSYGCKVGALLLPKGAWSVLIHRSNHALESVTKDRYSTSSAKAIRIP